MLNQMLLIGSIADKIGDVFKKLLNFLILTIDSVIFYFVKLIGQVFYLTVNVNLESPTIVEKMNELMNRLYVILGIGMLFFVAYKILCLMADPDKFGQNGNDSMQGIAKNVVISVIMISLIPITFDYIMQLQARIISTNVIGNIILGTGSDTNNDDLILNSGSKIALTIYSAFYYPVNEDGEAYTYSKCKYDDPENPDKNKPKICQTYVEKYDEALTTGKVKEFILDEDLNDALVDGQMEHVAIIPVVAGAYAAWLYLLFTIDVAIRAIKLIFYRLIAPVPVMMRVIKPVGGTFTRWTNEVIKTFTALFLRLIIINFAMFTINLITEASQDLGTLFPSSREGIGLAVTLAQVALIIGVLQFAKDSPKMVEDLFNIEHIDTSTAGMKNRINENEYAKRAAVAGGALGRGGAKLAWNAYKARHDPESEQYKARLKRQKYKEEHKKYRQGLSGAGKVVDSLASVAGAVGAVGRTAGRVVETAANGWNAGNVDINDIGNTIKTQDAKNQEEFAKRDAKRGQRLERATKNGVKTGSYFFPGIYGALGNLKDDMTRPVGIVDNDQVAPNQNTKFDPGWWLKNKIDSALGTSNSARLSADKAAITDAKTALERGLNLKFMSGKDAELDAEKASRKSAIISTTQRTLHEEDVSYQAKLAAVKVERKHEAVSSVIDNYSNIVDNNAALACADIDANTGMTLEQKITAKQQVMTQATATKEKLQSGTAEVVVKTISEIQKNEVEKVNNHTILTAEEKTAQIQKITQQATESIDKVQTEFKTIEETGSERETKLASEHEANKTKITADESGKISDMENKIKGEKMDAKIASMRENSATLKVAFNQETEEQILSSIDKMSTESQSAIYSDKMAKILQLGDRKEDRTPEKFQAALRKTFSALRAGGDNITADTVKAIDQLKKSLGNAMSISELAAVNSGNKGNGGEKK